MKRTVSRMKEKLFTLTLPAVCSTEDKTTPVTKAPAPTSAPTLISIPPSPPAATKLEMTSGAPFPSAKNVTAARFWVMFSLSDKIANDVDKYLFDVSESK